MGSFISMLRGGPHDRPTGTGRPVRESDGTARFSKQFSDFILDLGDADSAKFEQEYFPEYAMILQRGPDLLRQLRAYVDSTQEIRTAITSPTAENEEAAWRKLGPSVMLLKDCYEHAQDIERVVPMIIEQICGPSNEQVISNINRNRGLSRSFADMMQYAFDFDALKSSIPAIQNDFSYYRRTLSRLQKSQDPAIRECVISNDVSNHMSLFYAYHNPLVKSVVDAASKYVNESGTSQHVLECLSALAAGSFNAIKQRKVDDAKLCVQVLVTCCILYDWISPQGVNGPQSAIDARAVLQLVRERPLVDNKPAEEVLRFNCRTIR